MSQQSQITIKRGMVFYLEEPHKSQPVPCLSEYAKLKKRPYVVVSNDKCNESGSLVHVAPCTSKAPSSDKWYLIPFKKYGGTIDWVDVGQIILIPKSLLTIANYSEALTKYTLNNEEFMRRLEIGCAKQMGCELEDSYLYDRSQITTRTTSEQPIINISLNIPGLETLSQTIQECVKETLRSIVGNISNVAPVENIIPTTEEPEVYIPIEQNEVVSTEYKDEPQPVSKIKYSVWSRRFSQTKEQRIFNTIKSLSKDFGGNLGDVELAKQCGVSYSTIWRYKKKLNNNNGIIPKVNEVKENKVIKRVRTIPNSMKQEFIDDFIKEPMGYMLAKYAEYGLDTEDKIKKAYTYRTRKRSYIKKSER